MYRERLARTLLWVIYPLDVMWSFVLLVQAGKWYEAVGICLYAVLSVMFERSDWFHDWFITQQRQVSGTMRRRLGLDRFGPPQDPGAWHRYRVWRFGLLVLLPPGALAISWMDYNKGLYRTSFQSIRFAAYDVAAGFLGDEKDMLMNNYLQVASQGITLCLMPNGLAIARRAIFLRAASNICFYEDLIRIVLSLMPLVWFSGEVFFALVLSTVVVVIMDVLGARTPAATIVHSFFGGFEFKSSEVSTPKDDKSARAPPSPLDRTRVENVMLAVSCLVPSSLVVGVLSFRYNVEDREAENIRTTTTLAIVLFIAALAATVFDEQVSALFPYTLARACSGNAANGQLNASDETRKPKLGFLAAWGLTLGVVATNGVLIVPFSAALVPLAVYTLRKWTLGVTFDLEGRGVGRMAFLALIGTHALILVGVAAASYASDIPRPIGKIAVILAMARSLAAVERPLPIPRIVALLAFVSAATMMFLRASHAKSDAGNTMNIAMATFAGVLMSVATQVIREAQLRLVTLTSQSSQFMDHALKQRYAAVGSVLEPMLERPELGASSSQFVMTLKGALNECRAGADMCHLSTFMRKLLIDPNTVRFSPVSTLSQVLEEWTERCDFEEISFLDDRPNVAQARIRIDRDVLRALLASLSPRPGEARLFVRLVFKKERRRSSIFGRSTPKKKPFVEFRVESEGEMDDEEGSEVSSLPSPAMISRETNPAKKFMTSSPAFSSGSPGAYLETLRDTICLAFGGFIVGRRVTLPLDGYGDIGALQARSPLFSFLRLFEDRTAAAASKTPRRPLTIDTTVSSSGELDGAWTPSIPTSSSTVFLPSHLSYAVLDDVFIMRTNVLRMCLQYGVGNSKGSFASGKTREEALLFPHLLASKHIDIAIVDENLEYDDGETLVSGTDIARQARARGFKQCLVLHSANAHLRDKLDKTVFDGFVDKTSKREEFLRGISKAWETYSKRTSMGSSTT